jgi:cytochrome c biogenesis factor
MNIDPVSQTLGLHAMINPMVSWIWVATAIMGLGGLIAVLPSRREGALARPAEAASLSRDGLSVAR